MTEIIKTKKVMKEREQHLVICPRCKKEILGYSVKQARYNYRVHQLTCKGEKQNEQSTTTN